ncbi:unnamed protein product [Calypogeia fissa]
MDQIFYSSLLQDRNSIVESNCSEASNSQANPHGSDFKTIIKRLIKVASPYWFSEDKVQARIRFAVVFILTLATTGISVSFSFLGRDFYNALANKDPPNFKRQLILYLLAFLGGIPVFVLRDYMRDLLAMRWRKWLTNHYIELYFENHTFYNIEAFSLMDNPDQRIVNDVNSFTKGALDFALGVFNALVDLICFSSILYGIYPPLFLVLISYSFLGTICSVLLGKSLVGLNFTQEKTEADLRYGLLRARENAESIAFYGGEKSQIQHLMHCLRYSMDNLTKLLAVSRNLNLFTSGYRYFIQLLPAAVVAPIYFKGKIDFGVINQSFAAFDHILGDLSLVVYQFQSITAFTAVVDRLGEFVDVLSKSNEEEEETSLNATIMANSHPKVKKLDVFECTSISAQGDQILPFLAVDHLTLYTPQYSSILIEDLTFSIRQGEHLLVMGPSGSGKTSLLRAIAGLWQCGRGTVRTYLRCCENQPHGIGMHRARYNEATTSNHQVFGEIEEENNREYESDQWNGSMIFFVPQNPFMVHGSLRQQLLYPTWTPTTDRIKVTSRPIGQSHCSRTIHEPNDHELYDVLARVKLSHLQQRCEGLDSHVEWATMLSHGEQQHIAFARLLLSRPRLALLDESTSAMDEENEAHLYRELQGIGVTYVSVAHTGSLSSFHTNILTLYNNDMWDTGYTWSLKPTNTYQFQQT